MCCVLIVVFSFYYGLGYFIDLNDFFVKGFVLFFLFLFCIIWNYNNVNNFFFIKNNIKYRKFIEIVLIIEIIIFLICLIIYSKIIFLLVNVNLLNCLKVSFMRILRINLFIKLN